MKHTTIGKCIENAIRNLNDGIAVARQQNNLEWIVILNEFRSKLLALKDPPISRINREQVQLIYNRIRPRSPKAWPDKRVMNDAIRYVSAGHTIADFPLLPHELAKDKE